MKLITQNGQLDLPQDFSLTMERNNPLLSGEGDASVPTTLPSSSRNLAALDHRERIDRAFRYINKVEAILQVGPVQKQGHLVISKMHRLDGIDASLAIDNSDLYVKAKEKSLKDIFKENEVEGISKITWASVEGAMDIMQDCYEGSEGFDFTIFPVAIAPYETTVNGNKVTHYQFNNEVNGRNLVYASRTVHEGDILMTVPEGYGIAPFLKLHRLLHRLFQCLGYTVTENCFDDSQGANVLAKLAIVHNCSDALVRPVLHYCDLVPSCKLSEFLEWLLAKFHVQPIVDSGSKTVKIVTMESMLATSADIDISNLVDGDFSVQLNPTKRIVLTPTNSIEGTEPAGDSFDKLVEKYGGFVEADEDQWDNGTYNDCLVLRKATGQFYALTRNLSTGNQVKELLGTNHFVYDRNNSDDTEGFSQSDVMPLMMIALATKRDVSPFIGERIHFHTSYNGEKEDDKQEIVLCQYAYDSHFAFETTGTTQDYIPYNTAQSGVSGVDLALNLTNFGLYDSFWKRYNTLILNNATHLTGSVKYNLIQFLHLDMSRPKLCNGQMLLPVSASAALADHFGMSEVEMILNKEFADGVSDTPITPSVSTGLKWVLYVGNGNDLVRMTWDSAVADWENTSHFPTEGDQLESYTIVISDASGSQFLGVPTFEGQVADMGNHSVQVTVSGIVKYYDGNHNLVEAGISGYYIIYPSIHCWYVAEPA